MREFYNFGVELALSDVGLMKTAGIGSALKGAGKWIGRQVVEHPLRSAAAVGVPGGALAALLAAKKQEPQGLLGSVEDLWGQSIPPGAEGGGGGLGALLQSALHGGGDTGDTIRRALAGGAGGAGLGALLGGGEHRGLGALIGGGLGAAGGAFAPQIGSAAKPIIDRLVGTGA